MSECSVLECLNTSKAKGLCNKHYLRMWKYGDTSYVQVDMTQKSNPNTPLAVRFWAKVDVRADDECWPWKGTGYKGYGKLRHKNKSLWAHRVSYELSTGISPVVVLHTCDNPPCVNPKHLVNGTKQENHTDAISKGRARMGRCSGEFSYQSKVTWDDVCAIRASNETLQQLMVRYPLSKSSLWSIRKGLSWKTPGEIRVEKVGFPDV